MIAKLLGYFGLLLLTVGAFMVLHDNWNGRLVAVAGLVFFAAACIRDQDWYEYR